jgi:hypothetical protein
LKILHSDAAGLVVDLAAVSATASTLARLRAETRAVTKPLLLVGSADAGPDAASVEDALSRLASPLGRLITRETQLGAKITAAQKVRGELEARLSAQAGAWAETLKLKHRVSSLEREITLFERLLDAWAGGGKLAVDRARPPMPRAALYKQIFQTVLAKQGVLKGAAT